MTRLPRAGHMSLSEYRGLKADIRMVSKYRNVKTVVDDITFQSRLEADYYVRLKLLKQAGKIQGFGIQPSFVIGIGIRYVADFIVCDKSGQIYLVDTKSVATKTATFKIKQKLMQEKYPWLELRIVTKED